jgi:leader peptidase (prepilin peptidase)/N-methyltransferase
VYLGARGGFGDGDVRLAPLLGAHLGWFDLWHVAIGLFMGFVIGAVVGVAMMAVGRAGRRTALPFGPFMALGAVVVILMGDPIIDVWLQR